MRNAMIRLAAKAIKATGNAYRGAIGLIGFGYYVSGSMGGVKRFCTSYAEAAEWMNKGLPGEYVTVYRWFGGQFEVVAGFQWVHA